MGKGTLHFHSLAYHFTAYNLGLTDPEMEEPLILEIFL